MVFYGDSYSRRSRFGRGLGRQGAEAPRYGGGAGPVGPPRLAVAVATGRPVRAAPCTLRPATRGKTGGGRVRHGRTRVTWLAGPVGVDRRPGVPASRPGPEGEVRGNALRRMVQVPQGPRAGLSARTGRPPFHPIDCPALPLGVARHSPSLASSNFF